MLLLWCCCGAVLDVVDADAAAAAAVLASAADAVRVSPRDITNEQFSSSLVSGDEWERSGIGGVGGVDQQLFQLGRACEHMFQQARVAPAFLYRGRVLRYITRASRSLGRFAISFVSFAGLSFLSLLVPCLIFAPQLLLLPFYPLLSPLPAPLPSSLLSPPLPPLPLLSSLLLVSRARAPHHPLQYRSTLQHKTTRILPSLPPPPPPPHPKKK